MVDKLRVAIPATRVVANNWGTSVLAADIHTFNRREVARASFDEPREVTVTFAPSNPFDVELFEMQVEAELHIGAGSIAYVVPVNPSVRGSVVHVTCKTISVRLYSGQSAAFAKTQPRRARWSVGLAVGNSVKQPARIDNINMIGTGSPKIHRLKPWTTAVQLIPVRAGVIAPPDMTLMRVMEVSVSDQSPSVFEFQYEYDASLVVSEPMYLHHWTNALKITNLTGDNRYLHIVEHWQL